MKANIFFNSIVILLCLLLFGCGNDEKTKKARPNQQYSKSFTSYSQTPLFIRNYLDSVHSGKFLIAEANEAWDAGCIQEGNKPDKQFISAAIAKDSFQLAYWQGGIALTKIRVVLGLNGQKVTAYRTVNE